MSCSHCGGEFLADPAAPVEKWNASEQLTSPQPGNSLALGGES
jgi:hypothetical protein